MKKLFSAIAVLLFGAFCATADDAADVKQVFVRLAQYQKSANFDAMASLYSKDYIGTIGNGDVMTYSKIKAVGQMLKARDARTFLTIFMMAAENRKPTADELQRAEVAFSPAQLAQFKQHLMNASRREGDLFLKTANFIDIKVFEGKTARVVLEYTKLDPEDVTLQKTRQVKEIATLRKENGIWKFLAGAEF